MLAAVRVRGDVDADQKVSRTLDDLKLRKKHQCVVYEKKDSTEGMLELAKDYITYGEIGEETLEELEERKGEKIESGDTVELPPPSKGFKNTKKQVGQGGSLGKRENMDEIIERMV